MLNTKKLKIGNFVKEDVLGEVKVVEIYNKSILVEVLNLGIDKQISTHRYTLHIDNVSPIPITKEYLIKFGFFHYENEKYKKINVCDFDEIIYDINDAGIYCELFGRWFPNSYAYVHDLQNFYYSLMCQELETEVVS